MRVKCKCEQETNVSLKPIAAEAGYICVRCGAEHRKIWGQWCTVTKDEIVSNASKQIDCELKRYIDDKIEELLKGKT